MIDNNDIKIEIKRICKIEGGRFQSMCNQILSEMGYRINPIGSHDESDKTTSGTPDTFFFKDGCYSLVEYTTQQDGIFRKIKSDINKCIDKIKKCKIETSKIIYFYASSKLKLEEYKELNDLCLSNSIVFELYNIDQIANILREYYPLIAKEYLDIEVDTLQVLSPTEYIKEYNMGKGSVKINNKLLHREEEKKEIIQSIYCNDITLISGKSGCGKTHLILDMMLNRENVLSEYVLLCIKNKNQNLFNDLQKYLKKGKKYIILIDDINNINDMDQILYYLNPTSGFELKIIATVRDYARNKVIDKISDFENTTNNLFSIGNIFIKQLADEQLKDIIINNTKIKQELIIRNIIYVAQGNARIMMMAADIVKNSKNKDNTIEDVYNSYYKNIVKQLSKKSATIMKSLAVVSLLNVIDLKSENHKELILLANLSEEQFRSDILLLHENEIINMIDEDVAKISEQCISNYSMFLSIYLNKEINISDLIINMFGHSKSRLVEDLNTLLNVFKSKGITDLIKSGVREVWEKIDIYNFDKYEFLDSFGSLIELETLNYCTDFIKACNCQNYIYNYNKINESNNKQYPNNNILKLLGKFKYSDKIEMALNIALEYIKKDNSVMPEAYKLFAHMWGYGDEIYYNDFHIQKLVLERLIVTNDKNDSNIMYLTLNLIKSYLKYSGDYSIYSGKRNIVITQYSLIESDTLRNFRNIIFDYLIELSNYDDNRIYIIDVLSNLYSSGYGKKENIKSILEKDYGKVREIINKLLPVDFKLSILIENLNEVYEKFDIEYIRLEFSASKNREYIYYKNIKDNIDTDYEDDKTVNNMKKLISKMSEKEIYDNIDALKIIECEELLEHSLEIEKGISSYIIALFEKDNIDISKLLNLFIKDDILKIFPDDRIIKYCIDNIGYKSTKEIVSKYDYDQKFYLVYRCYSYIPDKNICKKEVNEFLKFISNKVEIKKGYYLKLYFLEKFLIIDKNIFIKTLNIINNLYEEDLFILSLLTSSLFNEYSDSTPEKLLKFFKDDYDSLLRTYLLLIKKDDSLDYSGKYFKMFINLDYKKFIDKYLKFIEQNYELMHNEYCLLKYIWEYDDSIIKYTIDSIMTINNFKRTDILKLLFSNSKEYHELEERYLADLVKKYSKSEADIIDIFTVVSNRPSKERVKCIMEFLSINNDYKIFDKIQLESYSWSWNGSEIPIIDERIKYFKDLLENIQKIGINYIKHCLLIEKHIESLEKYKKSVYRKEFLFDW